MRCSSWMEFIVHDLDIYVDEAVGEILVAHKNNDEAAINKALESYHRSRRLVSLGWEMVMEGLKEWDWKWAADSGNLCDKDWEWFKEDLEKAKINKEEFYKKWAVCDNGSRPVLKTGAP